MLCASVQPRKAGRPGLKTYRLKSCEFEAESKYTLQLRESNDILDRADALRERMAEDGYLLIRGLHDRDEVLAARRDILAILREKGQLDPRAPLMEGVVHPEFAGAHTISVRGREHLKTDSLKRVVYGRRVMDFFGRFLDEEAMSFNFQWLRVAGPGPGAFPHYDVVFMGRGSRRLYSCWTAFGDLAPEMGTLAICLGSHRWTNVIETYGQSDVDRDLIEGCFSHDASELVDRFGGRWATTTFRAGDALILSMFLMHASLDNVSNRFRISCDTRYQPARDPVDERWAGERPLTHPRFWAPGVQLQPVEESRKGWGV